MNIPLQQFWDLLSTYLRPQWHKVALLAILILSGIGLQVANPQIIRYFIDTALEGGETGGLALAAITFIGAALVLQVTTVGATYVGEDIGWTATNALRADLALHCLKLDMAFHNDRTPGEMIERLDGDIANLAIFFAQFVVRVLGSLLLLIGVLLVLLREDWRVSLGLTIYAVVALTALGRMRNIAVPHWKSAREASANLFGFLEEQLAGTEDVRSSGAQASVMRDLFRFGRERLQKERKAGVMNTYMVITWMSLFMIGQTIAFTSGYLLFRDGLLTIGTVYLIVYYTDAIFRPLEQITDQIQNLQKAAASIERVQELYNTPVRIVDGAGGQLPDGPLGVSFESVTFSYDTAHEEHRAASSPLNGVEHAASEDEHRIVLHNLDFRLQPGHVLGLLGRTGSGKTTITRLLFRLYEPTSGMIRIGHHESWIDMRATSLEDLRHKIGMVTQDVQLFRASVRDNLTFFDPSISDQQILQALEELGLGAWYHGLPEGLDTLLAAGGAGLSAGESQLLAFTRVFLKNPGLVILDEASSRLDPATEQLIERAVDRLLNGRTGIIVAHRLGTVHRADQIMILDHGQIGEFDDYRTLVANPDSRFSQLLRTGLEEVLV